MSAQLFPGHGEMHAHIDGRILVLSGDGIWNPEQYMASLALRAPLMSELNACGPWALMAVIRGDVFVHAGTLTMIKQQMLTDPLRANQVASAFVARPDQEAYAVMIPVLLKAMRAVHPCEVFATPEEAGVWLKQKIATAQSA